VPATGFASGCYYQPLIGISVSFSSLLDCLHEHVFQRAVKPRWCYIESYCTSAGSIVQPDTSNPSSSKPVLTSWKEVAKYLGKSVRTVQRWERHFGLPVRRLGEAEKSAVVAYPEELQAWLRSYFHTQPGVGASRKPENERIARLRRLTKVMGVRSEEVHQRLAAVIQSVNTAQAHLHGGSDAPLRGFTILAVDDNEAHNYSLSRILERSGSSVLRAFTGQEALELARRQPSLILLDIKLPDYDGYEVCRLLKAQPITAGIPVVFVTAIDRDAISDDRVKAAGGETVLFYPVETEILLAVVQHHLAN
jgi:CheY-like chemotaxis protein